MSFFQNKPAGTPSTFGTPQSTNTFSAFSTPTASKPGPFSVSGPGLNNQQQNTFGTPSQQQNTGTGGFGTFGANTNQGTGAFGQSNTQQGGGFFGQNTGQQQQQKWIWPEYWGIRSEHRRIWSEHEFRWIWTECGESRDWWRTWRV